MYKNGDIIVGKVTGIEPYGIFVSLGDGETMGLIHISEVSHSFVRNIFDYAEIGQEMEAKVIGIDEESKHLKLSIKDLENDLLEKDKKIHETTTGFDTLKSKLLGWINVKKREIDITDKNVKK